MNPHCLFRLPTSASFLIALSFLQICVTRTAFSGEIICGIGPISSNRASTKIATQGLSQLPRLDLPSAAALSEPVVVEIMFLYTPRAVIGAGDEASIERQVLESIAAVNGHFTNSQVNVRIDPVVIGRIDYIESGALDTDAARMANGEGVFSRAATLRNDYKADIVCLIVEVENMGAGGYAYDIPPLRGNAGGAFLVIRRLMLGAGSMLLAHELGHLFGCHHDREHAGDLKAPWLQDRRPYIFGHRLEIEGVTYVDIMSYAPGIHLPYFANPRITLDGVRLNHGIGWTGETTVSINDVNWKRSALRHRGRKAGAESSIILSLQQFESPCSMIKYLNRTKR